MLEIAGGIILAVFFFAALPYLVLGAAWLARALPVILLLCLLGWAAYAFWQEPSGLLGLLGLVAAGAIASAPFLLYEKWQDSRKKRRISNQ